MNDLASPLYLRKRPSRYSHEIADTICERLAVEGESLRTICSDPAMPTKLTVFRWLARYEEFRDMYGVAREWQTTVLGDDAIKIAFDRSMDIAQKRLRLKAYKCKIARLAPKKYGRSSP